MSWKQALGLVLGVAFIVAACFLVVFPALYERQRGVGSQVDGPRGAGPEEAQKSVLPRLKGVRWTVQKDAAGKERKKSSVVAEKGPADAIEEAPPPPIEEARDAAGERPETRAGPAAMLELQRMEWYEQGGFAVVEGAVKNVSGENLASVRVFVSFEDRDDNIIATEYSMLPLNPLFPGQASPFRVAARLHPRVDEAKVDFRTFSGQSIPWRMSEEAVEALGAAEEEAVAVTPA